MHQHKEQTHKRYNISILSRQIKIIFYITVMVLNITVLVLNISWCSVWMVVMVNGSDDTSRDLLEERLVRRYPQDGAVVVVVAAVI